MRVLVWALMGTLALIVVPIGVVLFVGLIRRLQIARTRRALERMGFVVSLPYAREGHPIWRLLGVGFVGVVALVLATSILPGPPAGRLFASTDGSSLPGDLLHHSVVPPSTSPASQHHSPTQGPTASQGAGSPPASTGSSASAATHAGSDGGAPPTVTALPTSATAIHVKWAPVTGAVRYNVERSTDTVTWSTVASTDGAQTGYTDGALYAGTTYYYRVAALVEGQDVVSRSDVVSATTTSTAPVLTSATASGTSVQLAWDDVDGELGYQIERSPDGTTGWDDIGTTGQGVISFTDTGLAPASTYYYRVVALLSDGGSSDPSTVLPATTDPDTPSTSSANASLSEAPTPP